MASCLLECGLVHAQLNRSYSKQNQRLPIGALSKDIENEVCYNPYLLTKSILDTAQLQDIVPLANNVKTQTLPEYSFPKQFAEAHKKALLQTVTLHFNTSQTSPNLQSAKYNFDYDTKPPILPGCTLKPFTNNKKRNYKLNPSDIKYINVLYTKEINFKINTALEITQTFHFVPDSNKTIGIDIGIKLNLK